MVEYSGNKVAKMSGVSPRTLRYYDEIGLLTPVRVASSGYRVYGEAELDTLQQILFYRELGFPLVEIKKLLSSSVFSRDQAFSSHLAHLYKERARLDALINNVTKSRAAMKGEIVMSANEKFEGFKQALLAENDRKYGAEVRRKFGEESVNESYALLKGLTQEQYDEGERLRLDLEKTLQAAFEDGDPAGELAQRACDIHRQWLNIFYPRYSKEYHKGLGEMYVTDERFRANYDKLAAGCTEFFCEAIKIYCS